MTDTITSIVITAGDLVPTGTNSVYQYDIPGSAAVFTGTDVALGSASIYNSQRNIDAVYANGSFTILIPHRVTSSGLDGITTLNINLPPGYYDYTDINQYVQNQLIAIGAYLVLTSDPATYVYFWELQANQTYYSAQLSQNVVPTLSTYIAAGYATPPVGGIWNNGTTTLPGSATTCRTTINSNFGAIVGLPGTAVAPVTYPSTPQSTNQVQLSTVTPAINPVASMLVRCSLVQNPMMMPSDILYGFDSAGVPYGTVISIRPTEYQWTRIPDQSVSNIRIEFVDQDFNQVRFLESKIQLTLLFKRRQ